MNNEPTNKSCPKCGAEIPPEAPQGLCPKCVMSGVATESGGAPPEISAGDAPSLERVAAAFPNLEVIELVGRGGMGFVYKARQPHLGRYVALKLLPDKLAADPHFAERFNREGRVLARLNHSNIVSVYDFGQTEHFYYLMMEFVDGVNLRQAMRAGKFSPSEALAVVPTICEALQYAHDQGVLHRDIKPENILLDTQGKVKIADFGIAKLVGEDAGANVTLTMTGSSLGTPHYMAPEQLEKPSEVDHRADIYSLGVVLYEMLTGELPIGRFEAPSSKTPVSKGVDDVVFRALEKNREKRQHSANEFRTQVETAGAGEVPPKLAAQKRPRTQSGLCWPAVIGAVLVGVSLLAICAWGVFSMAAGGAIGVVPFFVAVVIPVFLMSVSGTIMGWVGLAQIRRSQGALYGTSLALFAAVAYPFGLPALVIIGLPAVFAFQAGSGPNWITRIIIFLVIGGLLSALIWGVVAVSRWANNRPKGEHWSTRNWGITTVTLLVLMLLLALTASRGKRAEFRPAPVTNTFRVEERSPDGAVELLAISSHPSHGEWWGLDGSTWTNAPFQNPGHRATPSKDQKAFEFVFRLPPDRDPSANVAVQVAGSTGSSGGSSAIQGDQRIDDTYFLAALFPRDAVSTTIAVGVPDGGWRTLAETGRTAPANLTFTYDGEPVSLKLLSVTRDENGDVVVVVSHDVKEKNVRFVAVNSEGGEMRPVEESRSGGDRTLRFEQMAVEEIEKFRFQARPYRWAVFEDVWLMPRQGAASEGLSQQGVRINFAGVELVDRNGQERLEVSYETEENNAHLNWGTSGSFDNGPVDLLSSGSVTEQADGPAIIRHKASLLMPTDLNRDVVIRALQATREKWNGQSLVVLPGDKHTILTIEPAPGRIVSLTVGSKIKDP